MFVQDQVVVIVSAPWSKRRKRGSRLIKKANLMAVLVFVRAQSWLRGLGLKVVRTGYNRIRKIIIMQEGKNRAVECIAATWSCTKSFWFLRPMDELLSFRSCVGLSELRGLTRVASGLAVVGAFEPLPVDKRILTSLFRITI